MWILASVGRSTTMKSLAFMPDSSGRSPAARNGECGPILIALTAVVQRRCQRPHKMDAKAAEASDKLATGAVAAAEESAKKKDGPKVVEYLKTAGKWALDVAKEIGVPVAEAAIKGALGLP